MKKCPSCDRCYDDSSRSCEVAGHQTLVRERDGSRVIDGKYRLDSWIGGGAMGTVYKATHLVSGVNRAVKLLRPEYVSIDSRARERFRYEARTGDLLEHKHVVKIFDYGEAEGGQPYLAMELLEGQSLGDYRGKRQLPIEEAVNIALQAASGVEALHGKDILHRDLKPENIMLTSDERGELLVKLVDFGLAKDIRNLPPALARTTAVDKEFVGTIKYTSPENCNGEPLDHRSDIYSLGVILYEMLAGDPPFDGTNDEVERQHRETPPMPVNRLRPDAPPRLAEIVTKSLNKDPKERPQRAGELVDLLSNIVRAVSTPAAHAPAVTPPGGRADDTPPRPSPPPAAHRESSPDKKPQPQPVRVEGSRGGDQLVEQYITKSSMTKTTDSYTAPLRNRPGGVQYGPKLPGRRFIMVSVGVVVLLLILAGSCFVYPSYRSRRARGHLERGVALVHLNRLDEAVDELSQAVASDPTLSEAYLHRGDAHFKRGDVSRALSDYDETIRLEPHNTVAYRNRAQSHLAAGENDKAIDDYTQLLTFADSPDVYKLRGDAYLKSKHYEQAIADYGEVLKSNPNDLAALQARGDAYSLKGDRNRARNDYRNAQRLRTIKK